MLKRLQRVQNCAARLICRRKKHDHVTPLLQELHWLPIHVRPTYKLLAIAYYAMHGLAPEYLAELLDRHHPRRVLRSASEELFSVPFSQTVRYGDRRFSVAVATLWNQLPNFVRMIETLPLFRTHFKTHIFRGAFFFKYSEVNLNLCSARTLAFYGVFYFMIIIFLNLIYHFLFILIIFT